MLAGWAEACDLEVMAGDREACVASEDSDQVVDRAAGELNDLAATRAYQVVAMTGLTNDIKRKSARIQNTVDELYSGENLQRSVDRRPANARQRGDELLGSEGT